MKIELNHADQTRLMAIIGEIPHKFAVPILQFFNEIGRRQEMNGAAPKPPETQQADNHANHS